MKKPGINPDNTTNQFPSVA